MSRAKGEAGRTDRGLGSRVARGIEHLGGWPTLLAAGFVLFVVVSLAGGWLLLESSSASSRAARTSAAGARQAAAASKAGTRAAEDARAAAANAEAAAKAASDLLATVNGILDPTGPVAQQAAQQRRATLDAVTQAVGRLESLVHDNQRLRAADVNQQRTLDQLVAELAATRARLAEAMARSAVGGAPAAPATVPPVPDHLCRDLGNSGRQVCG